MARFHLLKAIKTFIQGPYGAPLRSGAAWAVKPVKPVFDYMMLDSGSTAATLAHGVGFLGGIWAGFAAGFSVFGGTGIGLVAALPFAAGGAVLGLYGLPLALAAAGAVVAGAVSGVTGMIPGLAATAEHVAEKMKPDAASLSAKIEKLPDGERRRLIALMQENLAADFQAVTERPLPAFEAQKPAAAPAAPAPKP